jgi:hypothetical protein
MIVGNVERRKTQLAFWKKEAAWCEARIAEGDRKSYWTLHCEVKPMIRALEISLKGVRA